MGRPRLTCRRLWTLGTSPMPGVCSQDREIRTEAANCRRHGGVTRLSDSRSWPPSPLFLRKPMTSEDSMRVLKNLQKKFNLTLNSNETKCCCGKEEDCATTQRVKCGCSFFPVQRVWLAPLESHCTSEWYKNICTHFDFQSFFLFENDLVPARRSIILRLLAPADPPCQDGFVHISNIACWMMMMWYRNLRGALHNVYLPSSIEKCLMYDVILITVKCGGCVKDASR